MGEGADPNDVTVVATGDRRYLDDSAGEVAFRHRAEAIALAGERGVGKLPRAGKCGAHHQIIVKADGRLERTADKGGGEKAGQDRAGEPAKTHAPPVGRPLREVADIEGVLVAEVDFRTAEAMPLKNCQSRFSPPSHPAKRLAHRKAHEFDAFVALAARTSRRPLI